MVVQCEKVRTFAQNNAYRKRNRQWNSREWYSRFGARALSAISCPRVSKPVDRALEFRLFRRPVLQLGGEAMVVNLDSAHVCRNIHADRVFPMKK